MEKPSGRDRRKSERYDTTISVNVRLSPDGTPVKGAAIEIGPNGMRLMTAIPLIEASYVHISFESASNNTFCEGRVVWMQPAKEQDQYESGIDVQRWGGGMPGNDLLNEQNSRPKTDRRQRSR